MGVRWKISINVLFLFDFCMLVAFYPMNSNNIRFNELPIADSMYHSTLSLFPSFFYLPFSSSRSSYFLSFSFILLLIGGCMHYRMCNNNW